MWFCISIKKPSFFGGLTTSSMKNQFPLTLIVSKTYPVQLTFVSSPSCEKNTIMTFLYGHVVIFSSGSDMLSLHRSGCRKQQILRAFHLGGLFLERLNYVQKLLFRKWSATCLRFSALIFSVVLTCFKYNNILWPRII